MSARKIALTLLALPLLVDLMSSVSSAGADSFPVEIKVDASQTRGDLKPIWRFFGGDEPNYGHMKDGRRFLGELGQVGRPQVPFRTHNLLTSGDGTPALKWGSTNAYTADAQGNPGLRLDDRGPDLRHLQGARPQALRRGRLHAEGALHAAGTVPARSDRDSRTARSTPAGRIRPRITPGGRSWSPRG